uniref:Link domain-containing protein n=1 Tax=Periophthalmus magnuspinnatus TaxID=409849 RepID=A0A3B4BBR0_9GOBI
LDLTLMVLYDGHYAGVFLIEGQGRHMLSYSEATDACEQLGTVLASPEQVQDAYSKTMETCSSTII